MKIDICIRIYFIISNMKYKILTENFEKLKTGVGSQVRTCFEVFFIIWTRRDQLRKMKLRSAPTTVEKNMVPEKIWVKPKTKLLQENRIVCKQEISKKKEKNKNI